MMGVVRQAVLVMGVLSGCAGDGCSVKTGCADDGCSVRQVVLVMGVLLDRLCW